MREKEEENEECNILLDRTVPGGQKHPSRQVMEAQRPLEVELLVPQAAGHPLPHGSYTLP